MCAKKDTKKAKNPAEPKKVKKDKRPSQAPKSVETDNPDFVHMVRVSGVVVDGSLTIPKALMKIKGVGPRLAESILASTKADSKTMIGNMGEDDIAKLEKTLESIKEIVPAWMINRRKDIETGQDIHRIGPELDLQLREDINREKKTKSYRGIRHALNLPVRGQRTRSTFRKGTSIGVSRKRK